MQVLKMSLNPVLINFNKCNLFPRRNHKVSQNQERVKSTPEYEIPIQEYLALGIDKKLNLKHPI